MGRRAESRKVFDEVVQSGSMADSHADASWTYTSPHYRRPPWDENLVVVAGVREHFFEGQEILSERAELKERSDVMEDVIVGDRERRLHLLPLLSSHHPLHFPPISSPLSPSRLPLLYRFWELSSETRSVLLRGSLSSAFYCSSAQPSTVYCIGLGGHSNPLHCQEACSAVESVRISLSKRSPCYVPSAHAQGNVTLSLSRPAPTNRPTSSGHSPSSRNPQCQFKRDYRGGGSNIAGLRILVQSAQEVVQIHLSLSWQLRDFG